MFLIFTEFLARIFKRTNANKFCFEKEFRKIYFKIRNNYRNKSLEISLEKTLGIS